MNTLYCPWRELYSESVSGTKRELVSEKECVFCTKFNDNRDAHHYIIKRLTHTIVIMNLYPYNAGHLLIIPLKHVACLSELTEDERNELMHTTTLSSEILKKSIEAQGINIGLNMGRIAGAGIPSHIHMHVIPRWVGDTNFLPIIAETKTISFDMNQMYKKLCLDFNQFALPTKQR